MVPADPHNHVHDDHDHHHGHGHVHVHAHGLASPHPAQPAPWSILRMPVASRLGAAVAVSAGLWAMVWLAMR